MSYKLIVQPTALADLDEAYRWIAERSPDNAVNWFNRFVEALATLEHFPERCELAAERDNLMPGAIVECVPNFSEGKDAAKIKQITDAIEATSGATLLDVDPGRDTNRTVVTFVGSPEAAAEAAFQAIAKAAQVIDMSRHHGAHPRMGATDVCPFVPVEGVTLEDCAAIARSLGARVGKELEIPVYLYEAAANSPERRNLANIREGQYEGLARKLADPRWKPDYGPQSFNPRAGATVIGARHFLIAYNITLNTRDKAAAGDIAMELREAGRVARTKTASPYYSRGAILFYREGQFPCGNCDFVGRTFEEVERHCREEHGYELRELAAGAIADFSRVAGQKVRRAGRFRDCKAIGWYVDQYRRAQISINLTNYLVTPPHLVLEEARRLAAQRGLVVTGSEVVGMIPYRAMVAAGKYYLARGGGSPAVPAADVLEAAVFSMGLSDVQPFDAARKVIGLPARKETCLVRRRLDDFVDEVSRDTPAPGGGSIAALAGAIGAALSSMVAAITWNKPATAEQKVAAAGRAAEREDLVAVAEKAQSLKDKLLDAVDEDTAAFQSYLDALRLPNDTPDEKQLRSAKVQAGLRAAVEVPYRTAVLSFQALETARDMVRHGLAASVSDAAVGCEMAFAGVRGGLWNVLVNLHGITDPQFVAEQRRQCDELLEKAHKLLSEATRAVDEQLAGRLPAAS
jgi:glutamate formiminotransferase/formiminotetrahydrofolate cyclodeaminase